MNDTTLTASQIAQRESAKKFNESHPRDLDAPLPDPGLTPLELAKSQVTALIGGMTDKVVTDLTQLRTEVDDTIRRYREHEAKLIELITRHQETGAAAQEVRKISADAMKSLRQRLDEEATDLAKLIKE